MRGARVPVVDDESEITRAPGLILTAPGEEEKARALDLEGTAS